LECISGCEPKYPSSLNDEEGTVVVQIEVDESGNVVNTKIIGGGSSSQMEQAALAAASKMKFKPPGRRVPAKVRINFKVPY
jgi:TonB family protein